MKLNKLGLNSLMAAFCVAGCMLAPAAHAQDLTIIYVPLDNRPVCDDYVRQTMEAAGCKIIQPPEKYIADNNSNANPEKIWEWLERKAPKADAAVISTDTLIYGGLVASRTHHLSQAVLDERVNRLANIKASLPIKLYAFSTIMRTPRASRGRVEPPYYAICGPSIFAYSELLDKEAQNKLTLVDKLKKRALERNLPAAELNDWLERRQKNLKVNLQLTRLARSNRFHYLAIGKDDNAPLSSTHMEARELSRSTFGVSPEVLQIIDGVDQLGMLLMSRAYNEAKGITPYIYTEYAPGAGAATLPQYSDARLQDSVPQQIIAAGAKETNAPERADFILAINSPADGIVKDSTADDNKYFASPANKSFVHLLCHQIDGGAKISLADISYSNGADNGFMNYLANSGRLPDLIAYNGWNTADNAIGFAIAQGNMCRFMNQQSKDMLMKQRLIDDWYYQSNARRWVSDALAKHNREEMKYELDIAEEPVLKKITADCYELAQKYSFTRNTKFEITFPWKRLFEVNVKIED